jgi:hypothetical protein
VVLLDLCFLIILIIYFFSHFGSPQEEDLGLGR